MNGHDEEAFERAYGPGDADEWGPRLDDDELIEEGPDCPYCGHSTEYSRGWITCDNCTVSWHGIEDLQGVGVALAAQGWMTQ